MGIFFGIGIASDADCQFRKAVEKAVPREQEFAASVVEDWQKLENPADS